MPFVFHYVSLSLSFTTVIGKPVEIVVASISLAFVVINGILKLFLKTMEKKVITENLIYWPEIN